MPASALVPLTAHGSGPLSIPAHAVLPFGIAALALVLGVWLIRTVIREILRFCESRQLYRVLDRMAERGELDADRMEEMLITAKTGRRRPAVRTKAKASASENLDPSLDRTVRIGFVMLALSLGFFAAAAFSGDDDLIVPGCLVGGLGVGLSGLRATRREAHEREGADASAIDVVHRKQVGVGTPP